MEQRRMSLRLIDNPVDRLARTIEALLVIAPAALSVEELATATEDEAERVETALGLLASRYREGRSGIVLEQVAGGYAFRAAREAAEACARLVERPVQRGLSQAALETLAIVAYKQPISRAQIASIRGVDPDGVLRTLQGRGYIDAVGHDPGPGQATLYGTTTAFLEKLGLDRIDDLPPIAEFIPGADVVEALEAGLRVTDAPAP
jgi:segregation and condensation protein B